MAVVRGFEWAVQMASCWAATRAELREVSKVWRRADEMAYD